MKNFILTFGFAFACQLVMAQDLAAAGTRAVERYNTLNATLHFTEEQKDKVRSLINGIEEKQEYVKSEVNLTAEQKVEFTHKNELSFQQVLKSFLTESQKETYEQMLVTEE